jgi:hypothetical protein
VVAFEVLTGSMANSHRLDRGTRNPMGRISVQMWAKALAIGHQQFENGALRILGISSPQYSRKFPCMKKPRQANLSGALLFLLHPLCTHEVLSGCIK